MIKSLIILPYLQICFLLVLITQNFACKSRNTPSELTFTASRGDFVISVDAEGVLEAKKAHNIVTPNLRRARPQIAWLPTEGLRVKKGDIVVELEAGEIERDYISAIDEVEIAKADAKQEEAELTLQRLLLESQLKETEASLAASRLHLSKMEFEPPRIQEIRRLEISIDELELQKIIKKLVSIEKIQNEERARLQLKIKQAENKLKQSRHYLGQLQLTAPVDGFIEYARSWFTHEKVEVGGQLWQGMPIIKIPDLSIMQVKLQVSETEGQKLKQGQESVISVPYLGDLQLTGKVSKVAKVAKPIKRGSKIKKVEVMVEIDSTNADLVPGLTAECHIIIDKMKDVLTLPQECIFEKDSVRVVYVLGNSFYTPYPVIIEKYGNDFVAFHSNLTGGEKCALREPNSSRIKWPNNLKAPTLPAKADTSQKSTPADSLTKGKDYSHSQTKSSLKIDKS